MDLVIDKAKLHLGSKKAAFMVQVEKDAKFLAELNIMDYSLLVHHDTLCPPPSPLLCSGNRFCASN